MQLADSLDLEVTASVLDHSLNLFLPTNCSSHLPKTSRLPLDLFSLFFICLFSLSFLLSILTPPAATNAF